MMDVYNVLGKIFDSWFIYLNDEGNIRYKVDISSLCNCMLEGLKT